MARHAAKSEDFLAPVRRLSKQAVTARLMDIYTHLYDVLGDLGWWPAETREEVVIGAILVQNVSWKNTERAIANLRDRGLLSFPAIHEASVETLEDCVRPTRYYRTKAKKLKSFAAHLADHYAGDLDAMLSQPMARLREELLGIWGIGRETADDIVLYAAGQPSFVIDAYTKRIFHRLGFVREDIPYERLRNWFMEHLPSDTTLYNHYHALLDAVGHRYCSATRPRCPECPLLSECPTGQSLAPGSRQDSLNR